MAASWHDRDVRQRTRSLWEQQDRHTGDRERLFAEVARVVDATTVLYAGSYVDVAASFAFPDVTYVDVDDRAARFFGDEEGVREIVEANRTDGTTARVDFVHADYGGDLGLRPDSFDLLISLYAGFVSEHCTRYLRVGGTLLANPSHGDAAMASIDPRYRLWGVVLSRSGDYRVTREDLDGYMVPKKPDPITVERLHHLGKGIAYTRPAFAYLFERVA